MVAGEKSQPLRLNDSLVLYLKNINIDIFTLILYFFKFKPFNVVFFISEQQIWISNGGLADVLTVFARTDYTDDKVVILYM